MLRTEGNITGEGMAWHAAFGANRFLEFAKETGDPRYLEAAIEYFDALLDKTLVSPDGYRGWVGPYMYDTKYLGDVHISDAILVNPMLAFSEYIIQEAPAEWSAKYGEAARRYVYYARVHVVQKWLARGTWWDDGQYGGFFSWDHYLSEDRSRWIKDTEVHSSLQGIPFNKNMEIGVTLLRLYRLSRTPDYRDRAKKIFDTFKSRLTLFKDGYTWNYWEPVYPRDVRNVSPPRVAHWVGTHPYRDYQAVEMECIAEAYHTGVTFDRTDIERFISTNLSMWNGSFDSPSWVNSDHAANLAVNPDYKSPEPHPHWHGPAGTAWEGLAEFDGAIARLTYREAPSGDPFERRYLTPVEVLEFPHHSNRMFQMAFSMPSIIKKDDEALVACKMRAAGNVRVLLVSDDGEEVLKEIDAASVTLDDTPNSGLHILSWKPDVAAGNYRIRWQSGAEYRDFPVVVE